MSNSGNSGSIPRETGPHKWLFSKDEVSKSKTIRDGFTAEKELDYRQRATRFIQEIVEKLNDPHRGKISQACMCVAMIQMHRFYHFNSFKFFDYRDISAACLFLAGKCEESPRKLEHIVRVWWGKKFPKFATPTEQQLKDGKALIVQLENVILHTIAFDLHVDLPHPHVLSLMERGVFTQEHSKKSLMECAYFFATDVLCVTNWGIRYKAQTIAVCCVHIVCVWSNHEIPSNPDGSSWYRLVDPNMTKELLEEMTDEFIKIYKSCASKLSINRLMKHPRDPAHPQHPAHFVPRREEPPPQVIPSTSTPAPAPPPNAAPPLPSKKVDYNEYKERSKGTPTSVKGGEDPPPRSSFMPDLSARVEVQQSSLPVANGRDASRKEDKDRERRKDKERKRDDKRSEANDHDRKRDDDSRKRDHLKIAGLKEGYPMVKKPRPDVATQNFVPSTYSHKENIVFQETQKISALIKPEAVIVPPNPPTGLRFDSSLPPPPIPPQIAPPPRAPTAKDLEDGEVE